MPVGDKTESQGLSGKDRVIRVFISSTFRDMMRERDLLVKEVFPELRRKCAKRFVTFTEVGLRWGSAEEQSTHEETLKLCLDEIRACRPFFLGLLGERYGWVPGDDAFPADLTEEQPWPKDLHGKSATELEAPRRPARQPAPALHGGWRICTAGSPTPQGS